MNSSKDKTKSQCLGDNRVIIDQGPLAVDGERVEASDRGGEGGRGLAGIDPDFLHSRSRESRPQGQPFKPLACRGRARRP